MSLAHFLLRPHFIHSIPILNNSSFLNDIKVTDMSSKRASRKVGPWIVGLVLLLTAGGIYYLTRGKSAVGNSARSDAKDADADGKVIVEVMHPHVGGIDRICLQPGTIEPIESADLYSRVSGFLAEQRVDIGDVVKAGQILARISAPAEKRQVEQDAMEVKRAEAKVSQMKAAIVTAEADLGAATAMIALTTAEKKSKASFREYRAKQLDRIKDLVARMAIDAKLADEHEDQYQSAFSAESAASEAIIAASQKEAAARARVKEAEADLKYAEAEVATANAKLKRSKVLLGFTVIRAPFNGVVTKRNFHPNEFIRSADAGGGTPVLAVERTDKMRVIIQIPERDVPFVDIGDPAVLEVDALSGVVFKTKGDEKVEVTRMAASEDPHTRMMRTEIHIANTEGKLRRGMFGRVTLTLHRGVPNSLRIPSIALVGKTDGERGTVRVVRDGKVSFVPVRFGNDNGMEVEVLSGLSAADQVIVRANGALSEGASVTTTEAKSGKSGH